MWYNWAGTVGSRPERVLHPQGEADVIRAIEDARGAARRIKVIGSGHSCSPIAASDGAWQLSLERLSRIHHVDEAAGTASFDAGITLEALHPLLATHGLALSNLGTISAQSFAGAMATATHGSGMGYGILPCHVDAIRIVDGRGEVRTFGRGDADFFGVGVNLGALGVITSVTVRCESQFRLHLVQERTSLGDLEPRLETLLRNHEHVKFLLVPHTEHAVLWRADRTQEPATRTSIGDWLRAHFVANPLHEFVLAASRLAPRSLSHVNRILGGLLFPRTSSAIAIGHRVFNIPIHVRQDVMEYAIPLECTFEAIGKLRELIEGRFMAHLPIEVRFARGDDFWLSPAHGRDTCYVGVIMYRPYGRAWNWKPYFGAVEELMLSFGGRPHWGKHFSLEAAQMSDRYPRWVNFGALRRRMDPDGMFLNPFLERTLGC